MNRIERGSPNCREYGDRTDPGPSPMHFASLEPSQKSRWPPEEYKSGVKEGTIIARKQRHHHKTCCARNGDGAENSPQRLLGGKKAEYKGRSKCETTRRAEEQIIDDEER